MLGFAILAAALIFMAGMLPVLFMLGAATAYCVMTQQKILSLARTPRHTVSFYNLEDKYAGGIITKYEKAGYRVEPPEVKRNRFTGNYDFRMELM